LSTFPLAADVLGRRLSAPAEVTPS
jgi:hypothetical protein